MAIVGTGIGAVSYLVANSRAEQFGREQSANGFTAHARDLKSGAELWQVASLGGFLAAGAAGMTAAIVW